MIKNEAQKHVCFSCLGLHDGARLVANNTTNKGGVRGVCRRAVDQLIQPLRAEIMEISLHQQHHEKEEAYDTSVLAA